MKSFIPGGGMDRSSLWEAGCPLNPTAAESVRCLELSLVWKTSLDAYVSGMWAEAQIVFLTSELVLTGQTPA